jgi:hypothetical protein
MANLRNMIFKPFQRLMAAFETRALLKHQLLLLKRLKNQRITTSSAIDREKITKDGQLHARDELKD